MVSDIVLGSVTASEAYAELEAENARLRARLERLRVAAQDYYQILRQARDVDGPDVEDLVPALNEAEHELQAALEASE